MLTSAIDVIDNKLSDIINKSLKGDDELVNINEKEFFQLKQRGYIFDSINDEEILLKRYEAINNKVLANIDQIDYWTICPSMECNLRCPYCYEDHVQNESIKRLSEQQLDVIFHYILNQKFNKKSKILIFGGEPLLSVNYKIVEKILRFTQKHSFPVGITTNGTSLRTTYLDLFSKHKGNLAVQITLDGDKTEHNKKNFSQTEMVHSIQFAITLLNF